MILTTHSPFQVAAIEQFPVTTDGTELSPIPVMWMQYKSILNQKPVLLVR